MRKCKYLILNLAWMFLCFWGYLLFTINIYQVKKAQQRKLMKILRENSKTKFGRAHSFEKIKRVCDFKNLVPIFGYEGYRQYVDKIESGEKNVLTKEDITLLEPTSGSTGAKKLIPYNKRLKQEFKNGIAPWLFNNFISHPRILFGSCYWSISPIAGKQELSKGGIPIGFNDDGEYFGKVERLLISRLQSVPPEICLEKDIDNFRYTTLYFLLQKKDLSFVSVWNPTFWLLLMDCLEQWIPSLITDLEQGVLNLPNKQVSVFTWNSLKPNRKRAIELKAILLKCHERPDRYQKIWPNLKVISCWLDGNSAHFEFDLKSMFPGVVIQPKGLLMTEGFISLPWKKGDAILSLRSHFFEFIDESGRIFLAHELEAQKKYVVVITTSGGLYRYRTGDVVEIIGLVGRCPIFRFIEREGNVSDLFGEKVNEKQVLQIVKKVFIKYDIHTEFYMVAPEKIKDNKYAYVLYIQAENNYYWKVVAEKIENELRRNYHYDYCRKLGQLSGFSVFLIKEGGLDTYIKSCCSSGQKLGDIKPAVLDKRIRWKERFQGKMLFK